MPDHKSLEAKVSALIETYGSEPALWPAAERTEAALALVRAPTPPIADAISAADALDGLLDELPHVSPRADLAADILAAAPTGPAAPGFVDRLLSGLNLPQPVLAPAGAAMASLVVGLVIGLSTPPSGPLETDIDPDAEEVLFAALGYSDLADFNPEPSMVISPGEPTE